MKTYLQRMGRSLMLPVATLPVAALFMGIGYWIDPTGWGGNNIFAAFMIKAGGTVLDNLGIIFAVGLALGMSKDKDGSSALAGLIAFLAPVTLVNSASVALFTKVDVEKVNIAFDAINNIADEPLDVDKIKKKAIPFAKNLFKEEFISAVENDVKLLRGIYN